MYKPQSILIYFGRLMTHFLLPDLDEEQNQSGGDGRNSSPYAKEVRHRWGWCYMRTSLAQADYESNRFWNFVPF